MFSNADFFFSNDIFCHMNNNGFYKIKGRRGLNEPDIAHLGIFPQLIKVLKWMVHGVNLQSTSLVMFSNISGMNRQLEEE